MNLSPISCAPGGPHDETASPHSESQAKQIIVRCICCRLNIWKSHFINIFSHNHIPIWPRAPVSAPNAAGGPTHVHLMYTPGLGLGLPASQRHSGVTSILLLGAHRTVGRTRLLESMNQVGLGVGSEQPFSVFSPDTQLTATCPLWAELGPQTPGNPVLIFPEQPYSRTIPLRASPCPLEPQHSGGPPSPAGSLQQVSLECASVAC